jgi:hypothetical protein
MLKTPVLVRSPKLPTCRWHFIRGVKLTIHLSLVLRSKKGWSCTSTPPIRPHGVVLSSGEHRDNFTFTFTLPYKENLLGDCQRAISLSSHVLYPSPSVQRLKYIRIFVSSCGWLLNFASSNEWGRIHAYS